MSVTPRCAVRSPVPYNGSTNIRKERIQSMPSKRKYGTLGGTLDELKSGQFLGNAQTRSSRRKSPWNLLLLTVLPLWLVLWWEGLKVARILAMAARLGPKPLLENLIWPG